MKASFQRLPLARPDGGFHLAATSQQSYTNVVKDLLSQLYDKLQHLDLNVMAFSKPIQLCYPMTYIHAISNELFPFNHHLSQAALTDNPVLQLKHVLAASIHSYSANLMHLKGMIPFDPILGQTYQGQTENCELSIEFSCVNPPTYHSLIVHKGGQFKLRATHVLTVSLNSMNSVKGSSSGFHEVSFKNTKMIARLSHAPMVIDQLIMGETSYNVFDHIDLKTNIGLSGRVDFKYQNSYTATKIVKGMAGWLGWGSKGKEYSDNIVVTIEKDGKPVSKGEGSWLSHLSFDDEPFWKISILKVENWKTPAKLLGSDTRFRKEVRLLKAKQKKEAQQLKIRVEKEAQEDAELRRKHGKG